MQEHIEKIGAFFESYRKEGFTGGIKIAFAEGSPHTLWISSFPEFKSPPALDPGFDLNEKLSMAASTEFSGSLFFILEKGEITNFYYNQTLQGKGLDAFFNKFKSVVKSAFSRKAVIAVRKMRQHNGCVS
jgi:hypothetical protein